MKKFQYYDINFINDFIYDEDKATPLRIHEHTPRIQRHPASARDAVGSLGKLHIYARCTKVDI
jgi:hypothetical protein